MLKKVVDDWYFDNIKRMERVRVSCCSRPYVDDVHTMSIPFGRRNCRWSTLFSPKGSIERSVFEERVVDGKKRLVVTGKENIKDYIESSKAETLISNIMKRFEQGDISVLSRKQGFYGDVTSMPSNLAEAQSLLINLENQFNSLPVELRQKFDNSFDKYVKEVSGVSSVEQFQELMNLKPVLENTGSESEGDSVDA